MIKVFFVCPTLGRMNCGIESFTRECFDSLSKVSSLDVTLFKGGGFSYKKDITLWNMQRDDWLTSQLVGVFNLISDKSNPSLVEEGTFF
ncbi:MAG: glycosyl transferase, partial [Cyanobacteria bacterium SW_7_48_12]